MSIRHAVSDLWSNAPNTSERPVYSVQKSRDRRNAILQKPFQECEISNILKNRAPTFKTHREDCDNIKIKTEFHQTNRRVHCKSTWIPQELVVIN